MTSVLFTKPLNEGIFSVQSTPGYQAYPLSCTLDSKWIGFLYHLTWGMVLKETIQSIDCIKRMLRSFSASEFHEISSDQSFIIKIFYMPFVYKLNWSLIGPKYFFLSPRYLQFHKKLPFNSTYLTQKQMCQAQLGSSIF
jgi:hypothetical protein